MTDSENLHVDQVIAGGPPMIQLLLDANAEASARIRWLLKKLGEDDAQAGDIYDEYVARTEQAVIAGDPEWARKTGV